MLLKTLGSSFGALAWLTLASMSFAQSIVPEPVQKPNPDDLKHGAVLCSWALYLGAKEAGDRCFPGRDPEFKASLAQGVGRIEDFVKRNGHVDQSYIASFEKQAVKDAAAPGYCKSAAAQIYQFGAQKGASALNASIDDLLSVPRMPVMNPCL